MNLIRRYEMWDPVEEFRHEMSRIFERSGKKKGWEKTFKPEVDVVEQKEDYVVKVDLPGIKKEELDIQVEGKLLTLKGERKEEKETKEKNYFASERFYGAFTRVIELPSEVKTDQVKAAYKDGVVEITLPKTESAKAKQIKVEVK